MRLQMSARVIVDAYGGHVLTNHHLVGTGDRIVVRFKVRRQVGVELIGNGSPFGVNRDGDPMPLNIKPARVNWLQPLAATGSGGLRPTSREACIAASRRPTFIGDIGWPSAFVWFIQRSVDRELFQPRLLRLDHAVAFLDARVGQFPSDGQQAVRSQILA